MKTNQNLRTINFKTILLSGVVTTLVVASSFAKATYNEQQFLEADNASIIVVKEHSKSDEASLTKPSMHQESEQEIVESTAPIAFDYQKPMVQEMVDNEQIIESSADFDFPIYAGRTLDEVILENEMIIESNKTDDVFPLNMYLINSTSVENRNGILNKNNSEFRS